MREIKFRGKRIDNGKWVYGYIWIVPGVNLYYILTGKIDIRDYTIEKYEIDPKTVGQYTGLKDKNGKEIYERDIVKIEDGLTGIEFVGVVAFENGSFIVHDGNRVGYRWLDYDREILGNICENPELLGVMK